MSKSSFLCIIPSGYVPMCIGRQVKSFVCKQALDTFVKGKFCSIFQIAACNNKFLRVKPNETNKSNFPIDITPSLLENLRMWAVFGSKTVCSNHYYLFWLSQKKTKYILSIRAKRFTTFCNL